MVSGPVLAIIIIVIVIVVFLIIFIVIRASSQTSAPIIPLSSLMSSSSSTGSSTTSTTSSTPTNALVVNPGPMLGLATAQNPDGSFGDASGAGPSHSGGDPLLQGYIPVSRSFTNAFLQLTSDSSFVVLSANAKRVTTTYPDSAPAYSYNHRTKRLISREYPRSTIGEFYFYSSGQGKYYLANLEHQVLKYNPSTGETTYLPLSYDYLPLQVQILKEA